MSSGESSFVPAAPYDALPLLPPERHLYESSETLKQEARARAAISELKGFVHIIPNQAILSNAIVLGEAKDSSEIENIAATQDAIYRAIVSSTERTYDPAAAEVLRCRAALWHGYHRVRQRGAITIPDIIDVQRIMVDSDAGIRRTPGKALLDERTNETIYTPPGSEDSIRTLLSNLADYLNGEDNTLIKLALIHYQFESIRPFYDGSGRAGRILTLLYLILKGHLDIPILYLSSYVIENKIEHQRLLLDVTARQQWIPWIQYFLRGIESSARKTMATVRKIKEQMDETIEVVRNRAPRIHSRELVEVLFEHPYCKSEFVERAVGVERTAASRYLQELHDIGLLRLRKLGGGSIFINTRLVDVLKEP